MSQFALDFSHHPLFLAENFIVSDCNREAHGWIMRWPDWPAHALLLYGDAGSGKSHLGHVWAARANATVAPITAAELRGNALVEKIETLQADALFHLLNTAKENGHSLLLTSRLAPASLPFTLPDLTSRLKALPATAISPPDDALLSAVMRKQFSDRQLKVDDEVLAYLLPRMERSFAHITHTVETLDRQALAEGKTITVPFARKVLMF